MRPELLFSYFADIQRLPGVGKRTRLAVERLAGTRLVDIVFHLPTGLIDRRYQPPLGEAEPGTVATLLVDVVEHKPPHNPRSPYKVLCKDATGFLTLVFFKPRKDWLQAQLPVGEARLISGKLEQYQDQMQITHPDYIVNPSHPGDMPLLETVYPLTAGLSGKLLRKAVHATLDELPELPEWQDPAFLAREGWPSFLTALKAAHNPEGPEAIQQDSPARRRLAYDELLATQLALALVRDKIQVKRGRVLAPTAAITDKIRAVLPYALTSDQETALGEIISDMASERAMLRLVQGDVGSGKTVVALLAAAQAVEAGAQAALLAPTEILARQHYATIQPLAESAGLRLEILTGRTKGKPRRDILEALAGGRVDIIVGTHALIQEDVVFKDLGLAIIDEQHRFGVQQRLALSGKAVKGVDVLGMTATPIPRTLTLTLYGDMNVSRIREKPPGRQSIDTRVISLERLGDVIAGLSRAVDGGARAYWVCPLVEESEQSDLAAAEDRATHLRQVFGGKVGLVHGRMKAAEKDTVMQAFQKGEISVLVATTVIEVGVDVPEATVMVVEHAERFGLSQLHQLRGRVGRGSLKSRCLLLRSDHIGDVARARLNVMRDSEDGFFIAEEDLRLRGGGEVLGTRQSGLPEFKLVDFSAHADLIETARDDARLLVARGAGLTGPRGAALRHLLYLFERDEGIRLMNSG